MKRFALRKIAAFFCAMLLPLIQICANTPALTYSELRAGGAGVAKAVSVIEDAKSGLFRYDATDTTSADDGGMVLVAGTKRYKRVTDVVTPQMYGAKGDGTTDDYVAFAAAINAANNQKKALYIPPTNSYYRVTETLTLTPHLRIYGEGARSAIKMIPQKNVIAASEHCVIERLKIICDDGTTAPDVLHSNGVYINYVKNVTVRDCIITNSQTSGIFIRNSNNARVENNFIYGGRWASAPDAADIYNFDYGPSSGLIIKGNYCLSNNSQGIFVSYQGAADNVIVSENVCITHKADLTLAAPGEITRRHGIMTAYNTTNEYTMNISRNICANTKWTGIYVYGSDSTVSGKLNVSENQIFDTGYDTGSSITAGIFLMHQGGYVNCHHNVIQRYRAGAGAIYYGGNYPANYTRCNLHHNVIEDSMGNGIYLEGWTRDVTIESNRITNPAGYGVFVAAMTGRPAPGNGGVRILKNEVAMNNANTFAIFVDIPETTKRNQIRDNQLRGHDKNYTNGGIPWMNSGIFVRNQEADVSGNTISNFRTGVYFFPTLTGDGMKDIVCDDNEITDCVNGMVNGHSNGALAPMVICQRNVFRSVTAPMASDGYYGGLYEGRKFGNGNVEFYASAIPTKGTYVKEDRIIFTGPMAGGWIGAVCTTSGSPGVWKRYGAISNTANTGGDIGEDSDGDGLADTWETKFGTNPNSANSIYRATTSTNAQNQSVISWPGIAGQNYSIQFRENIEEDEPWQTLVSSATGVAGTNTFTDTTIPKPVKRFYRIIAL